jgi:hypothetical protein
VRLGFAPATFSITFCCAYVGVFAMNWPLFLYYPLHGDWSFGPHVVKGIGPAMAWYGLMVDAGVVAVLTAFCVPDRAVKKAFRGYLWLFPCGAIGACVFLLRHFFS